MARRAHRRAARPGGGEVGEREAAARGRLADDEGGVRLERARQVGRLERPLAERARHDDGARAVLERRVGDVGDARRAEGVRARERHKRSPRRGGRRRRVVRGARGELLGGGRGGLEADRALEAVVAVVLRADGALERDVGLDARAVAAALVGARVGVVAAVGNFDTYCIIDWPVPGEYVPRR